MDDLAEGGRNITIQVPDDLPDIHADTRLYWNEPWSTRSPALRYSPS